MRSPVVAAVASVLLLASCSDDADEPVGFDASAPEFADDGGVGRGDVAERPADAVAANLAVDGVAVDLAGAVCVATGLDLPGGFAFEAALDDRDGSVSASIDPESGDAAVELFLDGELVPTENATATAESGVWQVRTGGDVVADADGAADADRDADAGGTSTDGVGPDGLVEVPDVLLSFECPTDFEERFRGTDGLPDLTPDPER